MELGVLISTVPNVSGLMEVFLFCRRTACSWLLSAFCEACVRLMALDFGRRLLYNRHCFLRSTMPNRRKHVLMSSDHNVMIITHLACFVVIWHIFSVLSCVYCSCDSVYCRCEVPVCTAWYVNSYEGLVESWQHAGLLITLPFCHGFIFTTLFLSHTQLFKT